MTTLDQLGRIVTGKTPPSTVVDAFGGHIPFVTPSDMNGVRIISATARGLSASGQTAVKNAVIPKNAVMVSCIGSDMGKAAIAGAECVTNQQINSIIVDEENSPLFVYYNLSLRKAEIRGAASGSAQPILNKSAFGCLKIELPPLEEQRTIAEILGALDDRIDNLRQTNATLQAIASALFKSGFVDFDGVPPEDMQESELGLIPKGWQVGVLGECCTNIRKQAKPDSLPPTTPYIGLEHMPRKSLALTEWGVSDGLASGKFWYQRHDILFGKLRPYFHKVGIALDEGVCSTDILVVRAKPNWFGFTAMHLFSDAMISYATQLSNGAKMPRTNWSDIAGYMIALPPVEVAVEFDDAIRPLIEKMHANIKQAATLAALRAALLPRLISGKLRIGEAA